MRKGELQQSAEEVPNDIHSQFLFLSKQIERVSFELKSIIEETRSEIHELTKSTRMEIRSAVAEQTKMLTSVRDSFEQTYDDNRRVFRWQDDFEDRIRWGNHMYSNSWNGRRLRIILPSLVDEGVSTHCTGGCEYW